MLTELLQSTPSLMPSSMSRLGSNRPTLSVWQKNAGKALKFEKQTPLRHTSEHPLEFANIVELNSFHEELYDKEETKSHPSDYGRCDEFEITEKELLHHRTGNHTSSIGLALIRGVYAKLATMNDTDPIWFFTDGVKLAIAFVQAVYAILQISSPTKAKPKKNLHYAELLNAYDIVDLRTSSFHWILYGFPWTTVTLTVPAVYIAFTLHTTFRKSSRISQGFGEKTQKIQAWMLAIMSYSSLLIRAIKFEFIKDFLWASIGFFGNSFAIACLGLYVCGSFSRLKNRIKRLQQLHLAEDRNKRDTSELEIHYDSVQSHFRRMILNSGMQEVVEGQNMDYNLASDVTYFVPLAANIYYLYYSKVPVRPYCCYPQNAPTERVSSRKSVIRVRSNERVASTPHSRERSRGSRNNVPKYVFGQGLIHGLSSTHSQSPRAALKKGIYTTKPTSETEKLSCFIIFCRLSTDSSYRDRMARKNTVDGTNTTRKSSMINDFGKHCFVNVARKYLICGSQ
eukprot:jgi/Bigna1/80672/fgenesh1_pg.73_\